MVELVLFRWLPASADWPVQSLGPQTIVSDYIEWWGPVQSCDESLLYLVAVLHTYRGYMVT